MKDLFDLCQLNMLEDAAENADEPGIIELIRFKKKELVAKIAPADVSEEAMKRHIERNTSADGVYPWTDSPTLEVEE